MGHEVQAADGAGGSGGHPGVNAGLVERVQAGQPPQHLSCLVLPQADGAGVGHGLLRTASSMACVGRFRKKICSTSTSEQQYLKAGQHWTAFSQLSPWAAPMRSFQHN
jgi:hypothetical protein